LLIQDIDGGEGRSLVPLYHNASPQRLWALSANKEDHDFRSALQKRLKDVDYPNPVMATRSVLSEVFKAGKLNPYMEAELKINPHKSRATIRTELMNKCLKIVLEEKN
jgi:hypothetical protein